MRRNLVRALRPAALVVFVLAAGCGKPPAFNEQVEGTVTLDGAPLPQTMVQFIPEGDGAAAAPASIGVTDANGRFRLTHDGRQPGAVLGKHRVVLLQGRAGAASPDPDAPPPPAGPPLPPEYSLAGRTPLHVEVTADRHVYDLKVGAQALAGAGRGD